jgi:hypothetical protein
MEIGKCVVSHFPLLGKAFAVDGEFIDPSPAYARDRRATWKTDCDVVKAER